MSNKAGSTLDYYELEKAKRAVQIKQLRQRLDRQRSLRYARDPVRWAAERVGAHLWSKQAEVAMSLVYNKRVAVQSAHSVGKSYLAALLACWWIDVHPAGEAMVVTTAPSYEQVHSILWEEIRRMHADAGLDGQVMRSDRWVDSQGRLMGMGRRPPDYNPHAFQGIHRKYVLVLVDEACGVPAWLWTAVEAITTADHCRVLAIGNPDDNSSTFAHACQIDLGWKNVKISAYDSPNLTGERVPSKLTDLLVSEEWVADKVARWGKTNPLFVSKVLGEFADSEDGLIPHSWVRQAIARWNKWHEDGEPHLPGRRVIGVDVARFGTDQTALAIREHDVIRHVSRHAKLATTETTGIVEAELSYPQSIAIVDVVGVGAGVVDQLRQQRKSVIAFNGGQSTKRRDTTGSWKFPNVRSAAWWNVRELLDPAMNGQLALPDDDELIADLTTPSWRPALGATILVEEKDSMRRRLGRSTDTGDAVCQSLWLMPADLTGLDEKPRAVVYRDGVGTWR